MTSGTPNRSPTEELLRRRLARERAARLEAEAIGERVTRQLFDALQVAEHAAAELRRNREILHELALGHQAAIVKLATEHHDGGTIDEALRLLTKVAARRLGVSRCGVWFLDGETLTCAVLYEDDQDRYSSGDVLTASQFPRYFAAVTRERALAVSDAITDGRTSELEVGYLRPLGISSMLDAAIRREGKLIGVVCNEHIGAARIWTMEEIDFAGAIADQVALIAAALERRQLLQERSQIAGELAETRELAIRDALTGLHNRRHLELLLEEELARSLRHSRPLAVAMLDIDHFKEINDRHGHRIGDEVLRMLGSVVRDNLRALDKPARYGGEELVLILPETTAAGAIQVADRVRAAIEAHAFDLIADESPLELRITVSIGIAHAPIDGGTAARLLEVADRAMYEAKALGRNRTVVARSVHHTGRFAAMDLDA